MANEDDKGYSVSDEKPFDLDRTDGHGRTLNSSNPVVTNMKNLGISRDLPKLTDEKTEKPVTVAKSEEKENIVLEKVADQEKATKSTESDLSSFTQWLKSLKQPRMGKPELTDPTTTVSPAREQTPVVDTKKAENEVAPEASPQKTAILPEEKGIQDAVKEKKAKKKKKKQKKQKQQADDSDPIILSDEVYSETLAELLESQGHTTEAIAMYEKLRLKYPEKSRFFAAKIEKLNKKA
jgi:hypothetical protein